MINLSIYKRRGLYELVTGSERRIEGKVISDQVAMSILKCDDDDLLLLMHSWYHWLRRFSFS
jgi:hypothetical protein